MVKSPWNELPTILDKYKKIDEPIIVEKVMNEEQDRNIMKDIEGIARRVAFGVVCGGLTGATFGTVEILRDAKLMSSKKSVAAAKFFRNTYLFGGFFGTYHGVRKTLQLYFPQPTEVNISLSSALTLTPLIFVPSLRPMIPFGIMLVFLDAINSVNE